MQKLEELRAAGHVVKIRHRRHWLDGQGGRLVATREQAKRLLDEVPVVLLPKGGDTKVTILDGSGRTIAAGFARCSRLDNFDRRMGLTIALGRAIKNAPGLSRKHLFDAPPPGGDVFP